MPFLTNATKLDQDKEFRRRTPDGGLLQRDGCDRCRHPAQLAEDDRQSAVTVEWRSHLKPKSGKNYSNTGVFVVDLADGKITWVREYFDTEKSHANV